MRLPQEIEIWYVIPAVRKELSNELAKSHGFSQKKIAEMMDVTESAVSQYKKDKRGKSVKLPEDVRAEIKKSAKKIADSKSTVLPETQRVLKYIRDTLTICDIHRMIDNDVPEGCGGCKGYL